MILRASKPVCEESTEVDMVPDSEPGPVYGLLRDSRVWKYLLPTIQTWMIVFDLVIQW